MKYLVTYYNKQGYIKKFTVLKLKGIMNIVKSFGDADLSRGVKITKIG